MARTVLTDNTWEQLQSIMKAHGCHTWKNDRQIMEAILWKLRTGAPWRDIPSELCPWKIAYNRFNRLSKKRVVGTIFFDLRASIDEEWVFADGSYIRCQQHSSGARRGELRATGKSQGGTTTKIHFAVDSHGNPIDFKITGGDVHDSQAVDDIIEMLTDATYFIADKAYDSEAIRIKLKQDHISPVIAKRKNTKQPDLAFDRYLYKLRHLVENTFARLKHYRSIATRYEKLARNYKSMLYLACTMIH